MGGHLSHLKPVTQTDEEVLKASCGPVRGNVYRHGEKIVDGYLGIPYAKPVVRFQKSEAAKSWSEVKDCTKYGPRCPESGKFQSDFTKNHPVPFDEFDCLTLNVFASRPGDLSAKGRPVMVFVHGGGYEMGSSAYFDDYSLSGTLPLKDVIVVTVNYRVGVLGFLTTGSENCPGNFGLWDITLALKWVQEHIKSFGGNPENVTLFGQSAGGGCVDLLTLSPHSRDLFHKTIAMSSSALCSFSMELEEEQAKLFKELAEHKGFKGNDPESLLEWYKSQPCDSIGIVGDFKKTTSGFNHFKPTINHDFFPKPLDELRKEAPKKPIMTGVCEVEGLLFIDPTIKDPWEAMTAKLRELFRENLFDDPEGIRKKIYDYYTKDVREGDVATMFKRLADFIGDAYFNIGVLQTAQTAAKYGNETYLYSFEYCNIDGYGDFLGSIFPFKAPTHGIDLRYVFGEGCFSKFEPDENDLKMLDYTTTIYTDFAKHGNPGWEQFSVERPEAHFRISLEPGISVVYQSGRCTSQLWDDVLKSNKLYQKAVYGKDV